MSGFYLTITKTFDRKSSDIIIGSKVFKLKYRNSWNAYISRSNIVGHNQNCTGTYWILDSINGRATGVPPVTVRGIDHRTEDLQSPAT